MRSITILLLALTVGVNFVLLNFPDLHVYALQQQIASANRVKAGQSVLDLMRRETEVLLGANEKAVLRKQLRLELPDYVAPEEVEIENRYVEQVVEIVLPNMGASYFYDYPMIGSSDHIVDVVYDLENSRGIIDISLDGVYELDVEVEGHYLHLGFVDPHELYDTIVVVDAGHGGNAVGATKQGIEEKNIDLAIVKELKKLFDKDPGKIGVYYTRLDDSNPSLENRVGLANHLEADLFLSIHNNSTASGRMSGINGTEVMYKVSDESGRSKQFAQLCLDSLLWNLGSQSKGIVAGDEIYIIRTSQVPVALAEIGFMTNQEELDKLNSAEYQKKSAKALYDAMMQMLEVLHE